MTDRDGEASYRPPCEEAEGMGDKPYLYGLDRRVCPNCREFFDVGEESDRVFCSHACGLRHKQGELL